MCAPTSPSAFSPGTAATVDNKHRGFQNRNSRAVDQRGAPALLRMGHLHRFLAGLGDDSGGYVDYSGDLVDPSSLMAPIPILSDQPYIPTLDSSLPSTLIAPTAVASPLPQLPPGSPTNSPSNSVVSSLLNAGSQAFKAATQPTVTSTLTPAQIAALRAGTTSTPLVPGMTNQNLLLLGLAFAAVLVLTEQ